MKKILLSGLLLVSMAFSLIACSGKATETPTTPAEATPVEEATTTP